MNGSDSPKLPREITQTAVFAAPGAGTNAFTYDPALVPEGASGQVKAVYTADGRITVEFGVSGLVPNRGYGAHAHDKPCGLTGDDAGPHFQHAVAPAGQNMNPQFANPQNEIWLDFTTDEQGSASVKAEVPWQFAVDRRAGSVVIHVEPTHTGPADSGFAGPRAGCVSVSF